MHLQPIVWTYTKQEAINYQIDIRDFHLFCFQNKMCHDQVVETVRLYMPLSVARTPGVFLRRFPLQQSTPHLVVIATALQGNHLHMQKALAMHF